MLARLSRADMMALMPGNARGAAARRAILIALLQEEPRTVRGLAVALGTSRAGVYGLVGRMERDGLLSVERRRGQHGSSVTLTQAGREAAKLV